LEPVVADMRLPHLEAVEVEIAFLLLETFEDMLYENVDENSLLYLTSLEQNSQIPKVVSANSKLPLYSKTAK
jgi:hypothetical protein